MAKYRFNLFLQFCIALLILGGCSESSGQSPKPVSPDFNKYWYSGEAELTRYKLEQARYGEIHKGDAVLIFVTEDFRADDQVKYEGGERKNVVPIIKLNHTRKFNTGIYPYSLMTSIFSPVNGSSTLKVSTSSQEWCGHSFTQLNYVKNKRYKGQQFSYFQSEGDEAFNVKPDILEDQLWTTIRIDPSSLPVGNISLFPGTQFLRFKHLPPIAQRAKASISTVVIDSLASGTLQKYEIKYDDIDRSLIFVFEKDFPHRILVWEESGLSGYGNKAKKLTTTATLTHQIKSPYWANNGVIDSALREELGLR